MNSLPEAVVCLILAKLPPETLVACDQVCTTWRRLIRDAAFIYNIIARSSTPMQLLSIPADVMEDEETYCLYTSTFVKQEAVFSGFPLSGFKVIGSCNGILCFANQQQSEYILCNPLLKMLKRLPAPLLSFDRSRCHVVAGFGFEGSENDFKILRFIVDNSFSKNPAAEMYSWGSDSWRRVELPTLDCKVVYNYQKNCPVFFEGFLYLLGLNYDELNMLLKFRLKDGEVEKIHLPEEIARESGLNLFLHSSKEGLLLFCLDIEHDNAGADVWSWSGDDEGWILQYHVPGNIHPPMGFLETGELIVQDMGWLKLYDPKKEEKRLLNIEYHHGSSMISYVPSLALLEENEVRDWILNRKEMKRMRREMIGRGFAVGRGMRTVLWMRKGRMRMRHQL